jgi:hypothetical protein
MSATESGLYRKRTRLLSQHGSMSDTATRFTLSGRPVGPKPSQLRDLGESALVSFSSTVTQHARQTRIMEQPRPLAQSTPPSVSIPSFQLRFLAITHPRQAPSSVYITDSTHNLNGAPSHSQVTGSNESEELYKRSVMLVIWYKVSYSTSF